MAWVDLEYLPYVLRETLFWGALTVKPLIRSIAGFWVSYSCTIRGLILDWSGILRGYTIVCPELRVSLKRIGLNVRGMHPI